MTLRPDFSSRSFDTELAVALAAAHEAGGILLRHYREGTEHWEKSRDNPVTKADLESDQAIVRRIGQTFPADGILSEETASVPGRGARRRTWIIDPMDGTKEFVGRIPEFAVSIALVEDGEPVVGVVLNPAIGRVVAGAVGRGAWQAPWTSGGVGATARAYVSSARTLSRAVVIASRTEISRGRFAPYADWFGEIHAVGSIAWKLACIACGEGDLNISVAPKNEWDVCAGDLLVREAGGIYVDFDGLPRRYDQQNPLIERFMAAGPQALVDAFCRRERARGRGSDPPSARGHAEGRSVRAHPPAQSRVHRDLHRSPPNGRPIQGSSTETMRTAASILFIVIMIWVGLEIFTKGTHGAAVPCRACCPTTRQRTPPAAPMERIRAPSATRIKRHARAA